MSLALLASNCLAEQKVNLLWQIFKFKETVTCNSMLSSLKKKELKKDSVKGKMHYVCYVTAGTYCTLYMIPGYGKLKHRNSIPEYLIH